MFRLLTHRNRKMCSALATSIVGHLILALVVFQYAREEYVVIQDALTVETIEPPPKVRRAVRKKQRLKPKHPDRVQTSVKPYSAPVQWSAAPHVRTDGASAAGIPSMKELPAAPNSMVANPVTTKAKIEAKLNETSITPVKGKSRGRTKGRGSDRNGVQRPGRGEAHSNQFRSLVRSVGVVDSGTQGGVDDPLKKLTTVPDDRLGAILEGEGADIQGHIRFTRLIHSLADWWQDPTALPSFMKWLSENTRLSADMKLEGGAMRMTDPRILDAPIIVMTGHDKELTTTRNLMRGAPWMVGFTPAERSAMRKYLVERGGMLFFDDCGFKGLFAARVADELKKILPEYPLQSIPHNHEIYTIHYKLSTPPNGSDIYWGSENNPKATKFKFQKGITIGGRLAVVYNRKDYLCAMETAEIASRTMLRMRRSADVHRFMVNMFVYAMKYGRNTDRTGYKRY